MQAPRSFSSWRMMVVPPRSGAENMARDTALLERAARTGETVLSVYSWGEPTLSFGRHQPAVGRYDRARILAAGMGVVRRPTGGRAILHDREVTYSVTSPMAGAGSLRSAYARINSLLVDALSRLGVTASLAPAASSRAHAPSAIPCFETPSEGELIANGRKLVGSAQWRDENALLQHGSILVEDDQSSLASLAATTEAQGEMSPPATLARLMGRSPAVAEVAEAMFDAVKSIEDPDATLLDEDEIRPDAAKHLPQFFDENWTWRR